jgi:hypothetical protein
MKPITINVDRDTKRTIAEQGFAWLPRADWSIAPEFMNHWQRLGLDWDELAPDRYMEHGATFRLRRYGRFCWSPASDELLPLPQEPYFQPRDENPYAGGIDRDFAPLLPDAVRSPFIAALVRCTFACLPIAGEKQRKPWEVRVHEIRVLASKEKPGQPAPEGIHQDGTDFLTLHLVHRHNVIGGETTLYDLNHKPIHKCILRESLDSLILEDPRIMHGVTPVHSADGRTTGNRDLLGLDFIYNPRLGPSSHLT